MRISEYDIWVAMKQRCYNTNHKEYFRYGGRGIVVCDEWVNSYDQFIKDMGKRPDKTYSLDRINNNMSYSKENCRWTTKSIQSYNQRISIDNNSGIVGVYLEKQTKSWKAFIRFQGKQITLGRFKDFFEACCCRKSAELKYYGE